jgi:selenocysteine-specific elongation factor
MIVGTAGHIDHGKTTLVKALTGVDTDRLPEEKKRGISIELGYAFLDTPAGARIGFIDVPGHERLVHTMLAGASGIDHALLLLAADDGVMPQTREHLAVLALLGVPGATVVVTKADRADAVRCEAVAAEAQALLAPTALAGSPVFTVSAATGQGLAALRERLLAVAAAHARPHDDDAAFRLAVDRVFTVEGTGTVVTGTVHAGRVTLGDELALTPGGEAIGRIRVRGVHAQNRAVDEARGGVRCALALAGVAKEAIRRGQWLVTPAAAVATARLDARVLLWPEEARALRAGTPVHVHIGAEATTGTVALLDAGEGLAPGASTRVQLVLRAPVGAWRGDRVVLRDAAASRTLAGGTVLDPHAPARYRRTPQRLAELDACEVPGPQARLQAALAVAPGGLDLARWRAAEGRLRTAALPAGRLVAMHEGEPAHALGSAQAEAAREQVRTVLAEFHARQPEELGPDASRLRRLALPRLGEALWRALLAELVAAGQVQQRGACLHLPEHGVRLSAVDERIAQKIAPHLACAAFEGVWARDLARDTGESEPLLRVTVARLAQRGEVHQVVRDLVYSEAVMFALAQRAREVAAAHAGEVTAARFRDATGLGRKRAIQILEYFDRVGLLRRVGDVHRLRTDTALFVAPSAPQGQAK